MILRVIGIFGQMLNTMILRVICYIPTYNASTLLHIPTYLRYESNFLILQTSHKPFSHSFQYYKKRLNSFRHKNKTYLLIFEEHASHLQYNVFTIQIGLGSTSPFPFPTPCMKKSNMN